MAQVLQDVSQLRMLRDSRAMEVMDHTSILLCCLHAPSSNRINLKPDNKLAEQCFDLPTAVRQEFRRKEHWSQLSRILQCSMPSGLLGVRANGSLSTSSLE